MAISKVTIADGCISCGICEAAAPDVFEISDIAHVKAGVDFNQFEAQIKDAAGQCPVSVIKVD